jgi:RES domain-containing protein
VITVYRLSSSRFEANSGAGAALFGGRWNGIGTPAIYTSESRSLAALEVLVHFDVIPQDFVLTEIIIPDELEILVIESVGLPDGWDAVSVHPGTQKVGNLWAKAEEYAVMSVPSSVIPSERNYVINPLHAGFGKIKFSPSVAFRFDARLKWVNP